MCVMNLKLVVYLLCSFTLSAHAINQSTVINRTDQNIAVTWTALGCLHEKFYHGQVCAARVMSPGHSHRYQYNWGATNDHIHIGGYFEKINKYAVVGGEVNTGIYPNIISETIGGNCVLSSPDKKVVVVNSITVDQDRWTVDCNYSIHNVYDNALISETASQNNHEDSTFKVPELTSN